MHVSTGLPPGPVQGPAVPPRREEAHSAPPWSIVLKTRKLLGQVLFLFREELLANLRERDISLVAQISLSKK